MTYDEINRDKKIEAMHVKEPAIEYGRPIQKKQGEYTIEDYYAWPEDERIELIDGVIYDMGAPYVVHQDLVGEIAFALKSHIRKNKGACRVYESPIDVQLDCDEKTMVQPDVLVVCECNKITERNLLGAPDMVVEVLSKSTQKKDMSIKLHKYSNAGVREYWIVDPKNKKVIVYDLENDIDITIYTFEDKVPVKIFNKECVVDFAEINDYIEEVFPEQI